LSKASADFEPEYFSGKSFAGRNLIMLPPQPFFWHQYLILHDKIALC